MLLKKSEKTSEGGGDPLPPSRVRPRVYSNPFLDEFGAAWKTKCSGTSLIRTPKGQRNVSHYRDVRIIVVEINCKLLGRD